MRLLDTTGANLTEKVIEVNKSIGTLTIKSTLEVTEMPTEKINIQVQRANGDNIEITNGDIPLREYILLGTMGGDAIGSDSRHGYKTKATIELVEFAMSALHLYEKDLLRISLKGLDPDAKYIIDGHEAPLTTDALYTFERKSMNSEHENMDFKVEGYDCCVLTDKESITEINLRFDNGVVVKTNCEELRDLAEAEDPVAHVKIDGKVMASFPDYLQLPLVGIVNINIRKDQGEIVSILFRHDPDKTNF